MNMALLKKLFINWLLNPLKTHIKLLQNITLLLLELPKNPKATYIPENPKQFIVLAVHIMNIPYLPKPYTLRTPLLPIKPPCNTLMPTLQKNKKII